MTLPFFYEPAISTHTPHFQLGEETSKHCIQVLRMKNGEQLNLTNGNGNIYRARIMNEEKRKCMVLIEEEKFIPRQTKKVCIALSLLKNTHRFEWFLEKATEIGVSDIAPVICHRTEHTRFRHDRMNQLLIAAMLQSQQVWLPVLHEPVPFKEIIFGSAYTLNLIAHCEEDSKQSIKTLPHATAIQILIGPEGDFSPQEIQLALERQFLPITLGQTRLRAETAGVVAAALLVNS
ncbi:MAG: 16S rRNA (uracil(1498)-N(3))-methyltransferase [Sediminibacterium sp.]